LVSPTQRAGAGRHDGAFRFLDCLQGWPEILVLLSRASTREGDHCTHTIAHCTAAQLEVARAKSDASPAARGTAVRSKMISTLKK
jgi:hypothetical protein